MFIWSSYFYFRDKLAFTQSRAASYYFDGSSYAVVRDITRRGKLGQVTRLDIEVRTQADNGLVLLMVNGVSANKDPHLLLHLLYFLPCMFPGPFPSWECRAIKLKLCFRKPNWVLFFFREMMSAISKSSPEMHFPAQYFLMCIKYLLLSKLREFWEKSVPRSS